MLRKNYLSKSIIVILALLVTIAMTFANTDFSYGTVKAKSIKWSNTGKTITMTANQSRLFKVKVTPKKYSKSKISYTSSDTAVATVDSKGLVKAIHNGSSTITAATNGKSRKTVTCKVIVGTKVTGVKWSTSTKTKKLLLEKKFSLKAVVYPANASNTKVKYTTSNKKVATVTSSGTVKGRKVGSATITASATDGSGKYVKCRVKVLRPVRSISVNKKVKSKKVTIGKKYKLKTKVSPSNASSKTLSYTSSNKKIAKVSKTGVVTGYGRGTATITIKTTDGTNIKKTCKVVVSNPLKSNSANFIAHRGLSSKYPENTVESFAAAASKGFYAIECDIWAVHNNGNTEFMIMHDNTTGRMCTTDTKISNVNTSNRDNYPIVYGGKEYKIPELSEYIDAVKNSNAKMFIEIKDGALSEDDAAILLKKLSDAGIMDRVVLISYNEPSLGSVISAVKKSNLETVEGESTTIGFKMPAMELLLSSSYTASELDTAINWASANNLSGVEASTKIMSASLISQIHAVNGNLRIGVWTVNNVESAREMINLGIHDITTNYALWEE